MSHHLRLSSLSVGIAAILLVSSCGLGNNSEPVKTNATVQSLTTANNLLYAPETWGFLEPSVTAEISQFIDPNIHNFSTNWHEATSATYDGLQKEMTEVEAAYVAQATLDTPLTQMGLTQQDLDQWRATAVRDRDIVNYYMTDTLLRDSDLQNSDPNQIGSEKKSLSKSSTANSLDGLYYASLFQSTEALDQKIDALVRGTEPVIVSNTQDTAKLLYFVSQHAQSAVEPIFLAQKSALLSTIKHDDVARIYLVMALSQSGLLREAHGAAVTIEPHRIQPDGTILELPRFAGTLGSTFRVLSFYAAQGHLDNQLSVEQILQIKNGVARAEQKAPQEQLAAMAINVMLGDKPPHKSQVTGLLAKFLQSNKIPNHDLTVEDALAWSVIAEYANILQVDYPFPGLAKDAASVWDSESDADVAIPFIRLLLVLPKALDSTSTTERDLMVARVEKTLTQTRLDDTNTFIIAGAALIFKNLGISSSVSPSVMNTVIQKRSGKCLGGFSAFIRESATPETICNVDVSTYVKMVKK